MSSFLGFTCHLGAYLPLTFSPVSQVHQSDRLSLFPSLRYISILVELTRLEGTRHGHLIASQMLDVAIRVKAIRAFAVAQMATLLDNAHLLTGNTQHNGICEVLYAAAWICGEFSEYVFIHSSSIRTHAHTRFLARMFSTKSN